MFQSPIRLNNILQIKNSRFVAYCNTPEEDIISTAQNPSSTNIYVSFVRLLENQYSVSVLDISGRVIFASKDIANHTEIPVSLWDKGIYIFKLTNETSGEIKSEKFEVK